MMSRRLRMRAPRPRPRANHTRTRNDPQCALHAHHRTYVIATPMLQATNHLGLCKSGRPNTNKTAWGELCRQPADAPLNPTGRAPRAHRRRPTHLINTRADPTDRQLHAERARKRKHGLLSREHIAPRRSDLNRATLRPPPSPSPSPSPSPALAGRAPRPRQPSRPSSTS